ncbi:MAG TPA: hypothetical protein VF591_25395 [Pyrinomonadaceae bacterium]|jgi:hypothetical protein
MKNPGSPARGSRPGGLQKLFADRFREARGAYELFDEFLGRETYDRNFCVRLLAVARDGVKTHWEVRRLAVLMLEHQILKLDPSELAAFDFLLTRLNLKRARGLKGRVETSVLREGYTTTELRLFVPEFRRKLERLRRVHDKIRGARTTASAIREFVEASRDECKLSLARYLFTAEEVVAEILRQVRVTGGVRDLDTSEPASVEAETRRALRLLPDFEANILRRLCAGGAVYWVAPGTSGEINSLVEYPATTVVLVVKPPGSDFEFEFKRAGRRGVNALSVVYSRDGYAVPPSHRLDGGSMQWLLRYEARGASRLGRIYRLAHGAEAPVAGYVARSTVYSVPGPGGEAQTLDYFTEPRMFGENFREMRAAMRESVAAFREEGNANLPRLPGALGLTAQFIGQVTPAQAILCGTTSFRLDKLAAYLSPGGPERYFKDVSRGAYTGEDAKRFADSILEEVLGTYRPPRARYRDHGQYVAAALAVAENRARADRTYLSLLRQIATFWGTLLAVRGYTRGESFVARNVGLKSFWAAGRWRVKVIFMDHDALVLPNPQDGRFDAREALHCMTLDERYIWGRSSPERFAASEMGCLQTIYRTGARLDAEGQALANAALEGAFKKTRHEMRTKPELRRIFHKDFVERLPDWDTLVGGYLKLNGDRTAARRWRAEMRRTLAANGYEGDAFDGYLKVLEKNRAFLQRHASLFDLAGGAG